MVCLWSSGFRTELLDGHAQYFYVLQRAVVLVRLHALYGPHDLESLDDFTEYGVLSIQVRCAAPHLVVIYHDGCERDAFLLQCSTHAADVGCILPFAPHELFNKTGKEIHISFGDVIEPEEIARHKDLDDLGNFLRQKTYALKSRP